MMASPNPIEKAQQVQEQVKERNDIDVELQRIRTIMKKDLGLTYRITRKIPIQANSQRCLVLRQRYAIKMIELLKSGKRIINIDESWLNETNFTRQMWCRPTSPATIPAK